MEIIRRQDYNDKNIVGGIKMSDCFKCINRKKTGILQPTASALFHNTSTLFLGLDSMKNLME